MTTWLSDASANRHIKTYVKDFLDVSGNMYVRNTDDYAWNTYGQLISGVYESDNVVQFGVSVGMDVSGLTIVVGANKQDGGNTDTDDGAVTAYRYDETAELWYQLGNVITETNSDALGFNLDMNDAGTRIMATDGNSDYVNVYDYNSSTNTWDKQVSITAHGVNSFAGKISGDGNTIVFSDYRDNNDTGKQYVYRNTSGTTWTLIGEFTGTTTTQFLGPGPALSYDGNRVSVLEVHYDFDADGNASTDIGRMSIYDYSGSGTTWNLVGDRIYGKQSGAHVASSSDFSKDGSIFALGNRESHYVEVYQYDASVDGSWKQLGTTIRGPTDNDYGYGVILSDDGTTLLVNDPNSDTAGTDTGALYIYKYTNGDWVQQGSTLYGQYTGGRIGYYHSSAIAMSGDGTKIVAGGDQADVNGNQSGYVQAFQWSQKAYTNPALDISGGIMTMWGGAEHVAANYSVSQLGADIAEETYSERSNTLSFSSDGTTLYIGHQLGFDPNGSGDRTGSFRVMKYRNGEWYKIGSTIAPLPSEIGIFQGPLGNTYYNGGGLSSDGTRAIGSWRNEDTDSSTEQKGLIRVYDLSGGDWVQVGNDIEGDSPGDLITSPILSGDGNTVAYRSNSTTYAKIVTYNSSTNTWDLQTTITTGGVFVRGFSYDGTIRVDTDNSTSGDYKVVAYKYSNGSWSQIGQGLQSYEVTALNMALSKYGDYLLVGDRASFSNTGVAIVYKYSSEGDKWMQLGGNIQNPFSEEREFVTVVDISEDGKTIVLTDYLCRGPDALVNAGAYAVYKYFDGNWTQIELYHSDTGGQQLGAGAAMCDNGELFAVSSGGKYFARVLEITNNPALKIEDGKVGIGKDSPYYKLDILGSDTMVRLTNTYAGGRTTQIFKTDDADWEIGARGSTNGSAPSSFYIYDTDYRMVIDDTGNVGIGTTSPSAKLHIDGISSSTTGLLLENSTGANRSIDFLNSSGLYRMGFSYNNEAVRLDIRDRDRVPLITLAEGSGRLGIGTTAPAAELHVHGTTTGIGPTYRMSNGSGAYWQMIINSSSSNSSYSRALNFRYQNNSKGWISPQHQGFMNTFTGQHICDMNNIKYTDCDNYIGLIVSANNNDYLSLNNDKMHRGNEAITISEAVPVVDLTSKPKDKSCFGVLAKKEDENNRTQSYGVWVSSANRELGDNRIYINSLGEGAIWVSNMNGSLESGDYITTSSLSGYGTKQDDDVLHNYTVAKITMDCDFQSELVYKKQIKRVPVEFYTDASNNTYDMSNNLIYWGAHDSTSPDTEDSDNNIQYYNKVFDNSDNIISVTKNILDANGDMIWEDSEEQERKYKIRYVDASANILTEEEYNTKKTAGKDVYIAAFVGCTYHCG